MISTAVLLEPESSCYAVKVIHRMELRLVTAARTQAQKILARWGCISPTNVSKAGTDHFNQGPTVLNVSLLSCDSERPLSALLIACFLALTTIQLIEIAAAGVVGDCGEFMTRRYYFRC